ncbi:conserved virulence factor C family protein [Aquibacillus saliphilus]|uniref:conserved virulence factor C family protein n=1 Tax=Aquibacillus saliphilus TaxID=1909422 RepID=UPI001CF02D55
MKIVSIEPTPSPHSMKINLDETLTDGKTLNFKLQDDLSGAPDYVKQVLSIDGVKGIYHVVDFIALERNPKHTWESILPKVREKLGTVEPTSTEDNVQSYISNNDNSFGEIKVLIQMFRDIPMQIKLEDGSEEKRYGLPTIFTEAVMKASEASTNFVMERKWVEQNVRYGTMDQVGEEVAEELSASYDLERLNHLVELALNNSNEEKTVPLKQNEKVTVDMFNNTDWKVRYAALDRLIKSTYLDLPVLEKALNDEKASIRRLATAYLGMIEEPEVLPYLYQALKDKTVTVRRTAGDCISDLGFKEAMPEMIASLTDSNRLVRWRAAMFLYEVGDESAISALKNAKDEPEFEVRMQIQMALERIEGGEEAKGSVWHQMTQATKQK